jgi:uncharacterized membrane protein YphA (DoxX/SURF4 family)
MARALRFLVAGVWLIHGLYNKLLGGSPRHLAIVQSVPGLGGAAGARVLLAVGVFEVAIAIWMLSRRAPRLCAAVQSVALLTMNAVELRYAHALLLWPAGLIPLNLLFLAGAWYAADARMFARMRARLQRHPFAIDAHFDTAVALTYAVPADVLRPLLPPGLELETVGDDGFVAVALVETRDLRPAGWPRVFGQDFFLAGYRIFTVTVAGRPATAGHVRRLRGLRILRSDTDRARTAIGGNLLTHYNYHRCRARISGSSEPLHIVVTTPDGAGDLDVRAGSSDVWVGASCPDSVLPPSSPFGSVREARRFAGPLPFTFDYEAETGSIVAIEARRTNWTPMPIDVDVRRIAFFDQPAFAGCTPRLAAAFRVDGVDYHWNRGVVLRVSERAPASEPREVPRPSIDAMRIPSASERQRASHASGAGSGSPRASVQGGPAGRSPPAGK